MTDKEQALVAATYRSAVDTLINIGMAEGHYEVNTIKNLTPSDAEAKLRELMVKVAEKAFISGMNWQHDKYGPPFDLIVDEVLNTTER